MRLNFSNLGKGLEAIAGAKQARDLAEASKAFENNITEGAYGPALGENLQQVIGARDQALQGLGDEATPEQRQQVLDQYTPAMSELSRRVGLQAPDYSVGGAGVNYATRDQANMANAGLRAEALGKIYRQYGDVERADALEARALEQRRGLAAELRAQKQFETGEEEAKFRLARDKRDSEITQKLDDVDKQAGEFLTNRLTDKEGNTRAATTDDMIAQLQHRTTLLQQSGLGKQATDALKDYQNIAVNAIQLQRADREVELGRVAAAIGAGDLTPARAFYDKFVHDGAKTTNIKENKDGSVTVSRVRDDGTPLPDTKIASKDALLNTLNSFRDPMALYNYSKDQFERNLKTEQLDLQRRNTAATEGQLGLARDANKRAEAKEARDANPLKAKIEMFREVGIELTPAQIESFGGLTKDESPYLKAKLDVIAKSVDPLRPGSAQEAVKAIEALGLETTRLKNAAANNTEIIKGLKAENKAGNLTQLLTYLKEEKGMTDSDLAPLLKEAGIKVPKSAAPPAASPAAAPTASGIDTSRTGTGEVNPYVTTSGRPTGVTMGAPSIASQVLPQVAQSVENAIGTTATATRYLQGKISRNEPLSPADTVRARQLGLIK